MESSAGEIYQINTSVSGQLSGRRQPVAEIAVINEKYGK